MSFIQKKAGLGISKEIFKAIVFKKSHKTKRLSKYFTVLDLQKGKTKILAT